MAKASISFAEARGQLLSDPEVRRDYERQAPYYNVIKQIITARKNKGFTQSELAEMIGTKKSNISRLESGKGNPTLDTLIKLGRALDVQFVI